MAPTAWRSRRAVDIMARRSPKKRKVDTGVYRLPDGRWEVFLRVVPHPLQHRIFPANLTREQAVDRRDELARDLRRTRGARPLPGTLAKAVDVYLPTFKGHRSYSDRKRDLDRWVSAFGHRRLDEIAPFEVEAQLVRWQHAGFDAGAPLADGDPIAGSTLNHMRSALSAVYTKMNAGRQQRDRYNPCEDVPKFDETEMEPRGLPFPLVRAILDSMPDWGQGLKGKPRERLSKTKARLAVEAFCGLSPAQIMKIEPKDIDLDAVPPTLKTHRRRKGKGKEGGLKPLLPEGVEALKLLIAADAWDKYSTSSVWMSFQRACRRLERAAAKLAADGKGEPIDLSGLRPYDLRHSYGTKVYLETGDLKATADLLDHASTAITERYTKAAVPARLVAAISSVSAAFEREKLLNKVTSQEPSPASD
jgi:integrase